jgi:hypothetical protein
LKKVPDAVPTNWKPNDLKIKEHTKKVRELEKKHPSRGWRFGLSKEQQGEVEGWCPKLREKDVCSV